MIQSSKPTPGGDQDKDDYDFLFKLMLIGNSSVGKSSILLRFSKNIFTEAFLPTIGVDFIIKTFSLQQEILKLQIWDTGGQERFKSITTSYYKGAQGVALVFDLADRQTFKDIDNWIADVEKYASKNVCKILIGNKCDLVNERQVKFEEAKEYADMLKIKYIETSAKTSDNVEKAIYSLVTEIRDKLPKVNLHNITTSNPKKKIDLENYQGEKEKKRCC